MKQISYITVMILVAFCGALGLAGCSGVESGAQIDSSKPAQAQNADAKIKAIQNDPHMPDVAKQSAIAQIKMHQVEAKDNTSRNPTK